AGHHLGEAEVGGVPPIAVARRERDEPDAALVAPGEELCAQRGARRPDEHDIGREDVAALEHARPPHPPHRRSRAPRAPTPTATGRTSWPWPSATPSRAISARPPATEPGR